MCNDNENSITEIPENKLTWGKVIELAKTVVQQKITRKKDLYVMIPYTKTGETSFTRAAEYKKNRLQKLYSDAEFRVKSFNTTDDFKGIWTEIYNDTTAENAKYNLKEIHYFGHSGHSALYLSNGTYTKDDIGKLEKLSWSENGALVFHSCRSSRYEDHEDKTLRDTGDCIARSFSSLQDAKVIGQMMYATYDTADTVDEMKYRNRSITNKVLVDVWGSNNLVLWGYKAGSSADAYEKDEEYKKLSNGQIWPCRGFNKGLVLPRVVHADHFNDLDLTYI